MRELSCLHLKHTAGPRAAQFEHKTGQGQSPFRDKLLRNAAVVRSSAGHFAGLSLCVCVHVYVCVCPSLLASEKSMFLPSNSKGRWRANTKLHSMKLLVFAAGLEDSPGCTCPIVGHFYSSALHCNFKQVKLRVQCSLQLPW